MRVALSLIVFWAKNALLIHHAQHVGKLLKKSTFPCPTLPPPSPNGKKTLAGSIRCCGPAIVKNCRSLKPKKSTESKGLGQHWKDVGGWVGGWVGGGGGKSNLIKNRSAPTLSTLLPVPEDEAIFGSRDFQDVEQRRREEQFHI